METTAQAPGLVNAIRAFKLTLAVVISRELDTVARVLGLVRAQSGDFKDKPADWRNVQGATFAQVQEQIEWWGGRENNARAVITAIIADFDGFIEAQEIADLETLQALAPAFAESILPRQSEIYTPAAREVLCRALKRLQGVSV